MGMRRYYRKGSRWVVSQAQDQWGLENLILPSKRQLAPLEPTWQLNDGTVFVHETKLIGAADHLVLPASHTGLLWYPPVAQQVDYFLRQGKFLHS